MAVKLATQDEVVARISGSYSGFTRAAATIFQENSIPYISAYVVHPDITRAGAYVFRSASRVAPARSLSENRLARSAS